MNDYTTINDQIQQKDNLEELENYAKLLLLRAGIVEVRTVKPLANNHKLTGWFDDHEALAWAVKEAEDKAECVYSTFNVISPDRLMASGQKVLNQLSRAEHTTKDAQITRRVWLPFDLDPARETGTPSTDDELRHAEERAQDLLDELKGKHGWPDPVMAMSGNGYHLLFPCDIPVHEESRELIKSLYSELKKRYSDDRVSFDTTVKNPARILKVYGTVSKKGKHSAERPHRRSYIVSVPEELEPLELEDVRRLVYRLNPGIKITLPQPDKSQYQGRAAQQLIPLDHGLGEGDYTTLNAVSWFTSHGCYLKPTQEAGKHAVRCPWESCHTDQEANPGSGTVIWEAREADSWPGFHCAHNSCAGRTIKDVMELWGDADSHTSQPFVPGTQVPGSRAEGVAPRTGNAFNPDRFVVLLGEDKIWDTLKHRSMSPSAMSLAYPKNYKPWKESPGRRTIDVKNLVFEPGKVLDPDRYINLFQGLEMEPDPKAPCQRMLDHLYFLCNEDKELYDWIMDWLAYFVQNPGAKMATAIIMRGPQGVGKNIFFESIVRIFGDYGVIIDQDTLERDFNSWLSRKLFILADEVVAKNERVAVKNKLKGLITGSRIQINEKYGLIREEKNCANFIFLSNEDVPMMLDKDDRRFLVVETPDDIPPPSYFDALGADILEGGDAGLYHYLLTRKVRPRFGPHTKPLITRAKARLIGASRGSPDLFLMDYDDGEPLVDDVTLPYGSVRSQDLFEAYEIYCKTRQHRAQAKKNFNLATRTRYRLRRVRIGDSRPYVLIPVDTTLDDDEQVRYQAQEFSDALAKARQILVERRMLPRK